MHSTGVTPMNRRRSSSTGCGNLDRLFTHKIRSEPSESPSAEESGSRTKASTLGLEELTSSNPSVLAFVRLPDSSADGDSDGSDRILCVNNLSRFPQPVELDLRRFIGVTPVECMGGVVFPRIGELSYLLTLPGHGFYWFQLPAARDDRSPAENRPALSDAGGEHGQSPATVKHLPRPPESHRQ